MLDVPVGFGHLIDAVTANQDRRRADEDIQSPEELRRDADEFGVAGNRAQIRRQRKMRSPGHHRDHGLDLVLVEIDHRDARARSAECERHFAPDAAGAASKHHALAVEAGCEIPGHSALSMFGGLKSAGSST